MIVNSTFDAASGGYEAKKSYSRYGTIPAVLIKRSKKLAIKKSSNHQITAFRSEREI